MHRTQLYIDDEQYARLCLKARREKKTVSAVVREALRLATGAVDPAESLRLIDSIAGAWKDRRDLGPTPGFVRRLRRGSRLARFQRGGSPDDSGRQRRHH